MNTVLLIHSISKEKDIAHGGSAFFQNGKVVQ